MEADVSRKDMLGDTGWMDGAVDALCKSLLSASLGILSQWMVTPFRPPVPLAFSRGVVCP